MAKPSEELKRIYTLASAYIELLNKKCQAYMFNGKIYSVKELKDDWEKVTEGLK